jgi:hypothetical protein
MSGGHFGNCGYDYYKVAQFADELEEEILKNGQKREDSGYYDEEYYPSFEPEVIEYLKEQLPKMRKMAEIMRHIDYLYSGDHGDDSFMNRVREVENKYKNNIVWQETGDGV